MKSAHNLVRVFLATAALGALIGTISVTTTEAAPILNSVSIQNLSPGIETERLLQPQHDTMDIRDTPVQDLRKRQAPTRTTAGEDEPTLSQTPTPKPTTSSAPAPPHTTTAQPKPTTSNPAPKPTTTPSSTRASTTTTRAGTSSGGSATSTSTSSGTAPAGATPTNTGEEVPTQVSNKVFIGLGTVGGFIVFALGGFAFCRHRKKKNLASALLQQTAQFNNNNPYAKLPEPAASPKESLPMTPTKPLGTYNVVATYTPALADEIEIGLGDSVTMLQEFDDGWCMGVNNTKNGIKGVFPRHCVAMGPYEGSQHGAPGGPHFPPSPSFKAAASKRMSSIAPASGWDGYNGGYGADANYPPQPSPQYLGPNQAPPHQGGGGGGGGYYNGGGY
ncbi:hypothetical protein BG011_003101 [Mortierella polycephala]|uniref:SH3 domain-containing protein n=1 Tax=Mortierella polycephala TaxID=41804 RepID=A0A9P6Q3S8_9FUNG|nr:hypothetical protein BG011_003101 [Mortierella polycephala]